MDKIKTIIDYLCGLYSINRKDIDAIVNNKISNSITARYVITAVTTLRSSSVLREVYATATTETEMSDALSKAIINMYADNDMLNSKINKASAAVSRIKDANDNMKQMFEEEIKAAFDREKETTNALIEQYKISLEAKDKTYTLIMRNNNDLKKENKDLKEKYNNLKIKNDELKAMLALQTKNKVNKSEQVSDRKVNNNQLCKRLFHFWGKKDDKKVSVVLDTFISDILSNQDFSKAQKEFLMSCIESDMSYEEVKRIAKPELDVDMMDRLVKYYKMNYR